MTLASQLKNVHLLLLPALKRKRAAAAESDLQVRPIVKHTLSKELQLYYEKITKAVKGACSSPPSFLVRN